MKKIPALAIAVCLFMYLRAYPQNTTSFKDLFPYVTGKINHQLRDRPVPEGREGNKHSLFLYIKWNCFFSAPFYKIRDT